MNQTNQKAVQDINRQYRLGHINVDTRNLLLSAMEETVSWDWDSSTTSTLQNLRTKKKLQSENADLRKIISSLAELLLRMSDEVDHISEAAAKIADRLFVFYPPLREDEKVVNRLSEKVDLLRKQIGDLQSAFDEAESVFAGIELQEIVGKLEAAKPTGNAPDKESGEETEDEEIAALLASIEQGEDEPEEEDPTLPF